MRSFPGVRSTELRRRLSDIVDKASGPVSVAHVLERMARDGFKADRVSVHRNLRALCAAGVLHQLGDGQFMPCRHACDHHAHMILFCEQCQGVAEMTDHRAIAALQRWVGDQGFLLPESTLTVRGICGRCGAAKGSAGGARKRKLPRPRPRSKSS